MPNPFFYTIGNKWQVIKWSEETGTALAGQFGGDAMRGLAQLTDFSTEHVVAVGVGVDKNRTAGQSGSVNDVCDGAIGRGERFCLISLQLPQRRWEHRYHQ